MLPLDIIVLYNTVVGFLLCKTAELYEMRLWIFFQLQGLLMDWNCVLHDSNYTRVICIESLQNYIWNITGDYS